MCVKLNPTSAPTELPLADTMQDNVTLMLDINQEDLSITLRHELGLTLDKHINEDKYCSLSTSESHAVLRQLSSALAFIHSESIVHDAVNPENIMFTPTPSPHAVLIDFGEAFNQEIVGKDHWTLSGEPLYLPPEFLIKKKGPEGDVWALGGHHVVRDQKLPFDRH